MFFYIQCSRCGKRRRLTTSRRESLDRAIQKGWGSCGTALYCPECSKTWNQRNSKPMSSEANTFHQLLARINTLTKN